MTTQEEQQTEREKDFAVAERIIRAVENEWGIRKGEIRTRGRFRNGVHYDTEKQTAAYLIRQHTKLGWLLIGRVMGGRTNMTVRNAVEAAVSHIQADENLARRIRKLERALGFRDTVTELRRSE